jgi:hypothetical protein
MKNYKKEEREETALIMKKHFKGNCCICGKFGHRGSECWFKNKNPDASNEKQNSTTWPTGKNETSTPPTGNAATSTVVCNYCKKSGHKIADCLCLKRKNEAKTANKNDGGSTGATSGASACVSSGTGANERGNLVMVCLDVTFGAIGSEPSSSDDNPTHAWVGDTGATAHMTNSVVGLSNIKYVSTLIKLGDGKHVESPFYGDKHVEVKLESGETMKMILKNCKYVPTLFANLLSLTKAMESGWHIKGQNMNLVLSNQGKEIALRNIFSKTYGNLIGIKMRPIEHATSLMSISNKNKIEINRFHQMLGHPGEKFLRDTVHQMEIELIVKLEICADCAITKS